MGLFDSLFGSKEKSTSSIPKYLENASKKVINTGMKLVQKDKYTPYKGATVAGDNHYYDKAAHSLVNQRDLASENFRQADSILDNTRAGTKNYYSGIASQLDSMDPLAGDYFRDTDHVLSKVHHGNDTYGAARNAINVGHGEFKEGMDGVRRQLSEAADRGRETQGAISDFRSLPGIVSGAQDRAEGLQLGTNAGLRSTLGAGMLESGQGYDEAAGLTRKASKLDSTNRRAINDRINPYTSAVTDMALRDYNKQRGIAGKDINDAARAAGAFGGSRHGVAQGMFDEETSKQNADIITSQREKGYDAATRRLDADRGNLLSSAGQLSGMQSARDSGALGFAGEIGDLAARDAALVRQGGLDVAGATKDAASGRMAADQQAFNMDADTAKMLSDMAKSYSDESRNVADAKLKAQGQRFGEDMDYARQIESLGKNRVAQQGQQFDQGMDIIAGRNALAKGNLDQEQQRFGQKMTLSDMQRQLGIDDQKSRQAEAADLLAYGKEQRGIQQQKLDAKKARFDEREQYDYEQLNWLSSMIGGQPYSRATTGTKTDGPGNAILGALSTGLGAFLSDENEKEARSDADLEDILTSFRKMPVDDYDYKDRAVANGMAPDGRRTGPMAQDWAKEFGGDGKTVDIAQMLGKLAGAVKGLEERTNPKDNGDDQRRHTLPRRKVA